MEIKSIAVIGAGAMGRGIAYVSAAAGYRTIVEDASSDALEQGVRYIERSFEEGVSRGRVTLEQHTIGLAGLSTATTVEQAASDADLIIEAVHEDLELKRRIFSVLEAAAKQGTIFASNTSSISISEIASVTRRPERCIGMHFFNPVPRMKLLEIVRTSATDDATLTACTEVGRRMGKEIVVVRESPGFITSRINAVIGNEAFRILEEGVATAEDIDKALKLGLNHPMGPFELVDLVGLDVRLGNLEYLHKTLGEKYKPSPLLRKLVEEGRLGRKTGRGVFDYPIPVQTSVKEK